MTTNEMIHGKTRAAEMAKARREARRQFGKMVRDAEKRNGTRLSAGKADQLMAILAMRREMTGGTK